MSDTPKTDAHVRMMIDNDISPEGLEYFARDLERELAAAAIELRTLRTANAGLVEKVKRLEKAGPIAIQHAFYGRSFSAEQTWKQATKGQP